MSKRLVLLVSGFLMLLAVIAYATTMTVNIEPNKEGVIDKSNKVNIVVKLTSDLVIDIGQIVIEWNGQDITEAFLDSASSQLNDSKTEITFYYPISAADLEPGQHIIAATTGNGKWYDGTLTILDIDHQSLHFSYSSLLRSAKTVDSSQPAVAFLESTAKAKVVKPTTKLIKCTYRESRDLINTSLDILPKKLGCYPTPYVGGRNYFAVGQKITYSVSLKFFKGDKLTWRWYDPHGNLYATGSVTIPKTQVYTVWHYFKAPNLRGVWDFYIDYNNKTYSFTNNFTVG